EKRGVIIFTDPDYPGDRIRHIIDQNIPGCKHAFLPKKLAIASTSGKSVGIEHASNQAIQHALNHVYEVLDVVEENDVTKADLIRHVLLAEPKAKVRRKILGEYLHIGYTN